MSEQQSYIEVIKAVVVVVRANRNYIEIIGAVVVVVAYLEEQEW
jgi:hypothetical protein